MLNEDFVQVEIEIEPIFLSSGKEFTATGFVYTHGADVGRLLVDGEFLTDRIVDSANLKCSLTSDRNKNGMSCLN